MAAPNESDVSFSGGFSTPEGGILSLIGPDPFLLTAEHPGLGDSPCKSLVKTFLLILWAFGSEGCVLKPRRSARVALAEPGLACALPEESPTGLCFALWCFKLEDKPSPAVCVNCFLGSLSELASAAPGNGTFSLTLVAGLVFFRTALHLMQARWLAAHQQAPPPTTH